jgi:hypothetical protein
VAATQSAKLLTDVAAVTIKSSVPHMALPSMANTKTLSHGAWFRQAEYRLEIFGMARRKATAHEPLKAHQATPRPGHGAHRASDARGAGCEVKKEAAEAAIKLGDAP